MRKKFFYEMLEKKTHLFCITQKNELITTSMPLDMYVGFRKNKINK